MNTKDSYKINNRINNYIRELNDYKEDLDALEKMAKIQTDYKEDRGVSGKIKLHEWNKQIEFIASEQKRTQDLIEAAEYERMKIAFTNPKSIDMFMFDKRMKLNNELDKIKNDVDTFVQQK